MILKRRSSMILALFILILNISSISYGNSAEPPSIMIIVPDAPADLEISIGKDNTDIKAKVIDKIFEKYYVFYSHEINKTSSYAVNIKSNNLSYEVDIEKPIHKYQNIYTLDLDSRTLTPGKSLTRSIVLVSMRLTITLLIEGGIFCLFGFRDRKSWKVFLIINLITQGALNIWINGLFPIQSYLFIGLIALELLILIVESIVINSNIKEHKKLRRFLFVISANFLSLVAGGYILTVLPF